MPHGTSSLPGSDEVLNELETQSSSRHNKRMAIYNARDLLGSMSDNALPDIRTQGSTVMTPDASLVGPDVLLNLIPPAKPFPSPISDPKKVYGSATGALLSSLAPISKKRNFPDESDVHLRAPTTFEQAQINN